MRAKKKHAEKMREALYLFLDQEDRGSNRLEIYESIRTVEASPFFDSRTEQVIRWIEGIASKPGFRELADDLLHRRIYDRILVLTRSRNDSGVKWTKVDQVFGRLGERWQYRRNLMQSLEARVARELASKLKTKSVVERDIVSTQELIAAIKRRGARSPR